MRPRVLSIFVGVVFALTLPQVGSAAFDRCCFRVDTDVSGKLVLGYGDGPIQAVRGDHQLFWRWSVRQIARYGEKGRIFNAITNIAADGAQDCATGGEDLVRGGVRDSEYLPSSGIDGSVGSVFKTQIVWRVRARAERLHLP